jgi:hypothetical protein
MAVQSAKVRRNEDALLDRGILLQQIQVAGDLDVHVSFLLCTSAAAGPCASRSWRDGQATWPRACARAIDGADRQLALLRTLLMAGRRLVSMRTARGAASFFRSSLSISEVEQGCGGSGFHGRGLCGGGFE